MTINNKLRVFESTEAPTRGSIGWDLIALARYALAFEMWLKTWDVTNGPRMATAGAIVAGVDSHVKKITEAIRSDPTYRANLPDGHMLHLASKRAEEYFVAQMTAHKGEPKKTEGPIL